MEGEVEEWEMLFSLFFLFVSPPKGEGKGLGRMRRDENTDSNQGKKKE